MAPEPTRRWEEAGSSSRCTWEGTPMSVRTQFVNASLAALALTWAIAPAIAQAPDDDGGPVIRDSGVGYIDSAVPTSQFRLRFDSAWRNNRPTRAEFFYPKGGASGPGLPTPDPRIDY